MGKAVIRIGEEITETRFFSRSASASNSSLILGEGVYKQHTSTRRVRRSIPPSNRLPVRGPRSARPLRSGRSVRKPAVKPVGRRTIETYCVLPNQGGRRESHMPRRHTTVALRRAGPPPLGWRWFMSGAGSPRRPIEPPSPPGGDRGSPPPCQRACEVLFRASGSLIHSRNSIWIVGWVVYYCRL